MEMYLLVCCYVLPKFIKMSIKDINFQRHPAAYFAVVIYLLKGSWKFEVLQYSRKFKKILYQLLRIELSCKNWVNLEISLPRLQKQSLVRKIVVFYLLRQKQLGNKTFCLGTRKYKKILYSDWQLCPYFLVFVMKEMEKSATKKSVVWCLLTLP